MSSTEAQKTLEVKNGKSLASFYRSLDIAHLSLIIFPTEQCNFRCTYCYEDFKLKKMSAEVQDSILRLLDVRLPSLKSIDVSWFGGEPMLATDTISRINSYIVENGQNVDFASNITTNGYFITSDNFPHFVSLGISRWQISFDGFGDVHDQTRRQANGRGTFEKIWNNVKATRDLNQDFEVIFRLHFHPNNVESCKEFIEAFRETFGGDTRYKVYLKNVSHLGSPNDGEFEVFSRSSTEQMRAELAESLPTEHEWGGANFFDELYVCYAAQPNSIAIRSDGTLAKCTVALNSDKNSVGRILPDGRLDLDRDKANFWMRGFQSLDKGELGCPMHER